MAPESAAASIPIDSLYFLLSYARGAGVPRPLERADGEAQRLESPQSLVAWWLATETEALARRGLVRGYVAREKTLRCVRGAIDFGRLARMPDARTRIPCSFDDLDADTWANRRIARALRVAARARLESEADTAVRRARRVLAGVGEEQRGTPRRKLARHERHYRVALALCDIVLRFALPCDRQGDDATIDFRDFTKDGRWMGALFERFVREVIRREQGLLRYRPRSSSLVHLARPIGSARALASALLPRLETDICLEDCTLAVKQRTVAVIETKFYTPPLIYGRHDGKARLRTTHINQLYVYMKALAAQGQPVRTGILLYAASTREGGFDVEYTIDGFHLIARTLALDAPPATLIADVLSLLGPIA